MDAEILVSTLIEKLQNESTMIHHNPIFKKQLQKPIKDLHLLKQCLKVAKDHEASSGDSMNDQRMAQLLKAVYSADDAADTLRTREAFQTKRPSLTYLCSRILFTHEMKKFKHEVRDLLSHYHLLEMKDAVTSEVKDTSLSSQNDLEGQRNQQNRWRRISEFCFKEETDVVGLEEQINKLVNLTVDPSSPQVITVVGEGGSGKTTLIRNVYKKLLGMRIFIHHAWVRVPTLFRARYVFADILKQIKLTNFAVNATVSEEELIGKLNEYLKEDRFLIVIEDVETPKVWEALQLRRVVCNGSKIIITTRNKDVALHAYDHSTESSVIDVSQFDKDDSWQLFLKKVQIEDRVLNNNSELITLREQIHDICGGLPLQIVLLGGLLSTKELSYEEWSRVIERAHSIRGDILALGYQDLPPEVIPCFLYLGFFPRGFQIPVRRLIHLWVSEGFVTPLDPAAETVPEDLAEMYFEELVIRNMIHVRWRLDGSPRTCCMPAVLYDFFSPKAADVGLFYHQFQLSHYENSLDKQPKFAVRRLAACLGIKIFHSPFVNAQHLRSFVAFDTRISGMSSGEIDMLLNKIVTKTGFGLLKVLDLEGVYKPVLSDDALGKLLLLSYLGLRSTAIDSLPSSVGNLPCLETLDVKHTKIYDLPTSTWKAKKLRHLYSNWSCSTNFRTSSLPSQPPTNLHTIWGLCISDDGVNFLKMLTGLRKLGVTCTARTAAEEAAKWVSQLTKLHSLKLRAILGESTSTFYIEVPTMKAHLKLQDLYLLGRMSQRSVIHIEFPPNLKFLTLSQTTIAEDPMPVLGMLPHLHILRLFGDSNTWSEMTCLGGGFPRLLVLKLWKLEGLRKWTVEEGAMPCLRELDMRSCKRLQEATGLQLLSTLQKVSLINTPLTVSDFIGLEERRLYIFKRD